MNTLGTGRIYRMLRLIHLLQSSRSRSVRDLMDELAVSRRTLFRDLNLLESAGIPFHYDRLTGYQLSQGFFLPPVSLTVPETLGLMMLGKTASVQAHRPLLAPALGALNKLLGTVPEPMRQACSDLMTRVTIRPDPHPLGDAENRHHPVLQRCIDEGRVCRMGYRSPAEEEPFTCLLKPYALHFANRCWYVLGWTNRHREVRVLKLARIFELTMTDQLFVRPRRFKVSDKLGQAWQLNPEGRLYRVKLEFTPLVATNVSEVLWHPTQQQQKLPDGRCILSFEVDGINEIAWWVCGYADQVKVLSPVELKRLVGQRLRSALQQYE